MNTSAAGRQYPVAVLKSKDQPMRLTTYFYDQNKGDPLRDLTVVPDLFQDHTKASGHLTKGTS